MESCLQKPWSQLHKIGNFRPTKPQTQIVKVGFLKHLLIKSKKVNFVEYDAQSFLIFLEKFFNEKKMLQ